MTTTFHQLQPARPSDLTVAMAAKFTRKRLLVVLIFPALFVLMTPFLLILAIRILDGISQGCGILSLVSACFLTGMIGEQIRVLAPTPEQSKRAMESRFQMFWAFLIVCLLFFRGMVKLVTMMVGVLESKGGEEQVGPFVGYIVGTKFSGLVSTSMNTGTRAGRDLVWVDLVLMGCKLALGMILLGFVVGMRFLGPFSVVQCSTFPIPHSSSSLSSSSFCSSSASLYPYRERSQTYSSDRGGNIMANSSNRNGDSSLDGNAVLDRFLFRLAYSTWQWIRHLVSPTTTPLEQGDWEKIPLERVRYNRSEHNVIGKSKSHPMAQSISVRPMWQNKKYPKRYKCPPLSRTVLQIFLHGYFGALFAQSTVSPSLVQRGFDAMVVSHVVCSCALLSSFTFLATYVFREDVHHELVATAALDAIQCMCFYHRENNESPQSPSTSSTSGLPFRMKQLAMHIGKMVWKQVGSCGFLFYWSLTHLLCLGILVLYPHNLVPQPFSWNQSSSHDMTSDGSGSGSGSTIFWKIAQATMITPLVTIVMSLYIMACDILCRIALLLPGLNAHRFILLSGAKERDLEVEEVMVEVILGGLGSGFLEYAIAPTLIVDQQGNLSMPNLSKKRGYSAVGIVGGFQEYDLEEEELRRNDAMILMVQSFIEQGQICGHTSLEDDLLKICVLESFGGDAWPGESKNAGFAIGLSERHHREVARLVLASDPSKGMRVQPAMVPILRALSAYLGGIGESLSECSTSSLYVSPCTKTALEYALNAASRFLVFNMGHGDVTGHSKKRFNRISLMIPTVLESIYKLRCGLCNYAARVYEQDQKRQAHASVVEKERPLFGRKVPLVMQSHERLNSILSNDASLERLVKVCDKAAYLIVHTVKEVDGSSDFDAKVRSEGCRQWLMSLLAEE